MKDIKRFSILMILCALIFVACKTAKPSAPKSEWNKLSHYEKHLIDSILQVGLDNEALYTLIGHIKPMSSLVTFSFPVANTDSLKEMSGNVLTSEKYAVHLEQIRAIQKAINKINLPDLNFILVPYASAQDNERLIQISVVRVSAMDSLLKVKKHFFGQFALVPGANPYSVANIIENNEPYARWRGYGYLFGYPDYAVDFFIQASYQSKKTGTHVPRNFFHIPTFTREEGNFVYAYPKDYTPTADIDSVLYNRAIKILNKYKTIRNKYLNADSTLQSYKLLQDLNQQRTE